MDYKQNIAQVVLDAQVSSSAARGPIKHGFKPTPESELADDAARRLAGITGFDLILALAVHRKIVGRPVKL